jgi:hypothetical protein
VPHVKTALAWRDVRVDLHVALLQSNPLASFALVPTAVEQIFSPLHSPIGQYRPSYTISSNCIVHTVPWYDDVHVPIRSAHAYPSRLLTASPIKSMYSKATDRLRQFTSHFTNIFSKATPTMAATGKKAVHFGGGNIGRGFVAEFL